MRKILCLIGAVFVAFLAVFSVPFKPVGILSSAEEVDVPDIMDGTIGDYNIENYPTANYFNVNVMPQKGTYDYGTVIERSNGLINSIVITTNQEGRTTGYVRSYNKLREYCPEMKVGETYTLTAKTEGQTECITLSGSYIEWYYGYSKTITEEMLDSYIAFWGYSGAEYVGVPCTISEIMINKGTTAYPYTPYYKTLYDNGYAAGNTKGYNDGYNAGLVAGLTGLFNDITVESYAIVNGVASSVYSTKPSVQNGEIALGYLYTYYNNLYANNSGFESVVLSFIFDKPYLATYLRIYGYADNPLLAFGDELNDVGNDFLANYLDGGDIAVVFMYDEARQVFSLRFNAAVTPEKDVVSLSDWVFTDINGLKGLRLRNVANQYYAGYVTGKEQGIQQGLEDGEKIGYDKGFIDGVENGKEYGYNDGYNAGETAGYLRGLETAEDGTLVGLIGVMFDAPLNASLKLLNFEILGVNMLGFFTGILTLMFVLRVLGLFLHSK